MLSELKINFANTKKIKKKRKKDEQFLLYASRFIESFNNKKEKITLYKFIDKTFLIFVSLLIFIPIQHFLLESKLDFNKS